MSSTFHQHQNKLSNGEADLKESLLFSKPPGVLTTRNISYGRVMFQSVICQWHNSSVSILNWLSFRDQRSRRDINQLDRCLRLRIVLLFKQKIEEQNKENLLFQISITLLDLFLFVREIDSIVDNTKVNLIRVIEENWFQELIGVYTWVDFLSM